MKKLVVIGAGGHGKVIADTAMMCGYEKIVFLDDGPENHKALFPIVGTCADAPALNDGQTEFVIGIGNNTVRRRLAEGLGPLPYVTLVHPGATVSNSANIGVGTVVMAGTVINACATVGSHCIVNTGAVVEHDCVLADYVHISPGAALDGTVVVGEETHIGLGVSVRNNTKICSGCIVGVGAAVVADLAVPGTYIGVPAKRRIL